MYEALTRHPVADAEVPHEINRALFQDAGAYAAFDVFPIALLDHDALDSARVQQQSQEHPGRPSANYADLGAHNKQTYAPAGKSLAK
jgi:hypothetical protein